MKSDIFKRDILQIIRKIKRCKKISLNTNLIKQGHLDSFDVILLVSELEKKFGSNISENINLSNYSWFNLGGPAEYFFKPENKDQLIKFLKENQKNKLKITILGAGSNTLIRDNGIKGVVIKLGKDFSSLSKSLNCDSMVCTNGSACARFGKPH